MCSQSHLPGIFAFQRTSLHTESISEITKNVSGSRCGFSLDRMCRSVNKTEVSLKTELSAIIKVCRPVCLQKKANLLEPLAYTFSHSEAGVKHDLNIRSKRNLWPIKGFLMIK